MHIVGDLRKIQVVDVSACPSMSASVSDFAPPARASRRIVTQAMARDTLRFQSYIGQAFIHHVTSGPCRHSPASVRPGQGDEQGELPRMSNHARNAADVSIK